MRWKNLGIGSAAAVATLFVVAHTATAATTISVSAGLVLAASDGQCSLVEAIENANNDAATHADCPAGSGADTILLGNALPYVLTAPLPQLTGVLTIDSQNPPIATISGAGAHRVFDIAAGSDITLRNLDIRDGFTPDTGGGLRMTNATLGLVAVQFRYNEALSGGGAIAVQASGPGLGAGGGSYTAYVAGNGFFAITRRPVTAAESWLTLTMMRSLPLKWGISS